MSEKRVKYIEIADDIKQKILMNRYPIDSFLPSENQLAAEYDVSRITIRAAIERLIKDNYIFAIPGKGTMVKEYSLNEFKSDLALDKILKYGYEEPELICAEVILPDINLVYNLGISPKQRVITLAWSFHRNRKPIAFSEKFIPYHPGLNIQDDSMEYLDFYKILSDEINIYEVQREYRVYGEISNENARAILQNEDSPFVMIVEQKLMDSDGLSIGYEKLTIRSDEAMVKGFSYL